MHRSSVGLAAVFVALLGCTEASLPIRQPECVTGAVAACLCEGALQGWQTCGADRRLGACVCGDGGAMVSKPPACEAPFAVCAAQCVSLLVDNAHCGRCGSRCPDGQLCLSGGCVLLADAGSPRPDVPGDRPDAGDDATADATDAADDATADATDAADDVNADVREDATADVPDAGDDATADVVDPG
jgi:hypothetical protein